MNKLKFYVRTHLKSVTEVYHYLRALMRNARYLRYMTLGGGKIC